MLKVDTQQTKENGAIAVYRGKLISHTHTHTHTHTHMGQVIEKRIIGAGQAKIIKLTITLNNFITLEDQRIPSI